MIDRYDQIVSVSVSLFNGISNFVEYLMQSHHYRKTAVVLFKP